MINEDNINMTEEQRQFYDTFVRTLSDIIIKAHLKKAFKHNQDIASSCNNSDKGDSGNAEID